MSVLCPMRVGTNIGNSERNRADDYGGADAGSLVEDQDEDNDDLAGRVLDVDDVAALTVDAVVNNRLYVLPHEESRQAIRRRFERIDRTFEQQPRVERPGPFGRRRSRRTRSEASSSSGRRITRRARGPPRRGRSATACRGATR